MLCRQLAGPLSSSDCSSFTFLTFIFIEDFRCGQQFIHVLSRTFAKISIKTLLDLLELKPPLELYWIRTPSTDIGFFSRTSAR